MTSEEKSYCKGCIYLTCTDNFWTCDYILYTGVSRGGPVGAGCKRKKIGNKRKVYPTVAPSINKKKWSDSFNPEVARQLFDEGFSDEEIAQRLGTTRRRIQDWRQRARLLRAHGPRKAKED